MKNILLLDGDPVFRSNIMSYIESDSQWTMLGNTTDTEDLLGYFSGQPVAVVMVSLELDLAKRTALVSWIAAVSPSTKLIWLISAQSDGSFVLPRFVEGVDGYLAKNISAGELLLCLQLVGDGGKYLSSELYMLVMEAQLAERPFMDTFVSQHTAFSRHEVQLLSLAAKGSSQTAIGQQLSMSIASVKTHFELLFEKTGTGDYPSLVRFALVHGIMP